MSSSTQSSGTDQIPGFQALKTHILTHKVEVSLWCCRILNMILTLGYLFPIVGNPVNVYYKALMANAATCALRLHQRQPRMAFSREYIELVFMEDSFHYFVYSVLFLYVSPFSLVLLPTFLFSLIHSASYSLILLDTLGRNSWWGARLLISLVELQSRKILSLIALSEILLMPFAIIFLFLSRAGLLTPFFYYQFVQMRYKSVRNPYTRNMFHTLRIILDGFAAKPNIPGVVKNGIHAFIEFVSRCAPPMPNATN